MKVLEHVAIVADDPESLADWYCQTLGFELLSKGTVVLGDTEISYHFLGLSGGALLEILNSNGKERTRKEDDDAGIRHIAFLVEDMDASCRSLQEKGIEVGPTRELPNGTKLVFFRDPEDNILQLVFRTAPVRPWLS
jgi:glyoxylase I family protein